MPCGSPAQPLQGELHRIGLNRAEPHRIGLNRAEPHRIGLNRAEPHRLVLYEAQPMERQQSHSGVSQWGYSQLRASGTP